MNTMTTIKRMHDSIEFTTGSANNIDITTTAHRTAEVNTHNIAHCKSAHRLFLDCKNGKKSAAEEQTRRQFEHSFSVSSSMLTMGETSIIFMLVVMRPPSPRKINRTNSQYKLLKFMIIWCSVHCSPLRCSVCSMIIIAAIADFERRFVVVYGGFSH